LDLKHKNADRQTLKTFLGKSSIEKDVPKKLVRNELLVDDVLIFGNFRASQNAIRPKLGVPRNYVLALPASRAWFEK
jgi:pyrimidine operon attenuation protein/uracil phosphoribosyltransferase